MVALRDASSSSEKAPVSTDTHAFASQQILPIGDSVEKHEGPSLALRGIMIGVPLSLILWAVIALLIW